MELFLGCFYVLIFTKNRNENVFGWIVISFFYQNMAKSEDGNFFIISFSKFPKQDTGSSNAVATI